MLSNEIKQRFLAEFQSLLRSGQITQNMTCRHECSSPFSALKYPSSCFSHIFFFFNVVEILPNPKLVYFKSWQLFSLSVLGFLDIFPAPINFFWLYHFQDVLYYFCEQTEEDLTHAFGVIVALTSPQSIIHVLIHAELDFGITS